MILINWPIGLLGVDGYVQRGRVLTETARRLLHELATGIYTVHTEEHGQKMQRHVEGRKDEYLANVKTERYKKESHFFYVK